MNLTPHFNLTKRNTLGLVSHAHQGAIITHVDELADLARQAQAKNLPLHIIGGGSNLVLREKIEAVIGIMATRGRTFEQRTDGTISVTAQAGEDWAEFVSWSVMQGAPGLENLAGIPGTVGAAPVQNIGAYGVEMADHLESLLVWDLTQNITRRFTNAECAFSYRQSRFKRSDNRFIVLEVRFSLPSDWTPTLSYPGLDSLPANPDPQTIMEHVLALRHAKLPDWRVLGNAGSFFHNPIVSPEIAQAIVGAPRYPQADGTVKLSAAWLIDVCGFKGYRVGQAGVYDKHALILVNHGGTTYAELTALANTIRNTVKERFNISLIQEPLEL